MIYTLKRNTIEVIKSTDQLGRKSGAMKQQIQEQINNGILEYKSEVAGLSPEKQAEYISADWLDNEREYAKQRPNHVALFLIRDNRNKTKLIIENRATVVLSLSQLQAEGLASKIKSMTDAGIKSSSSTKINDKNHLEFKGHKFRWSLLVRSEKDIVGNPCISGDSNDARCVAVAYIKHYGIDALTPSMSKERLRDAVLTAEGNKKIGAGSKTPDISDIDRFIGYINKAKNALPKITDGDEKARAKKAIDELEGMLRKMGVTL